MFSSRIFLEEQSLIFGSCRLHLHLLFGNMLAAVAMMPKRNMAVVRREISVRVEPPQSFERMTCWGHPSLDHCLAFNSSLDKSSDILYSILDLRA
jgi:hypothetical protein